MDNVNQSVTPELQDLGIKTPGIDRFGTPTFEASKLESNLEVMQTEFQVDYHQQQGFS